ncbi:MAG: T9SS type A sorting domain-containing protein [bacterium]
MKPNTIFLLLSCLLPLVIECRAQWVQTDGPYGNTEVTAIIVQNGLIMTGADCGTFTRNDMADRWVVNSPYHLTCYTLKGDTLFAGTFYGGIKQFDLSSPDIPAAEVNDLQVQALAHTDTALLAGTEALGFMVSDDFGSSWEEQNNGLPTDTVYDPWGGGFYYITNVTALNVTGGFIFCGTDHGIFRRNGNSGNWIEMNDGLPSLPVTMIEAIDDTLYTAINSNLFRSTDFGEHWNLIFTGSFRITSFLRSLTDLFLATAGSGIYRSADNGMTWATVISGLTDLSVTTLAIYDSTLVCGTSRDGFFFLQDTQWVANNHGLICSYIRAAAATDQTLFACNEEKVYRLNLAGIWDNISPLVEYELFGSVMTMGDTLFLSVENDTTYWPYDIPFILYSTNEGSTWQHLAGEVPFARDDPYSIHGNNGKLYAYEDELCFFTSDMGQSWTDITIPPQYCNSMYNLTVFKSVPYAAACGFAQTLKLGDDLNWQLVNQGLPDYRSPQAYAFCDSALFVFIEFVGMYVTLNEGEYWTFAGNGLTSDSRIRGFVSSGNTLYISTQYGIFGTKDFGQNWHPCNDGLKNLNTGSLALLNDTIFAGTFGSGIWKRALGDIHVSLPDSDTENSRITIYPNPARDAITIETRVHGTVWDLSLVNLFGQEILQRKVTGTKIQLNTEDLPAGIYLIKLRNSKIVRSGKLIIE